MHFCEYMLAAAIDEATSSLAVIHCVAVSARDFRENAYSFRQHVRTQGMYDVYTQAVLIPRTKTSSYFYSTARLLQQHKSSLCRTPLNPRRC